MRFQVLHSQKSCIYLLWRLISLEVESVLYVFHFFVPFFNFRSTEISTSLFVSKSMSSFLQGYATCGQRSWGVKAQKGSCAFCLYLDS
jgi:hypothetical protein